MARSAAVKEKKTFHEITQTRRFQRTLIIVLFSVIPLFLLFLFTYLPFGEMVGFSFYKMKYVGKRTFVGLQNYRDIFRRKDIYGALILSLYYMVGAVIQIIVALYLATVLSMKVRMGKLFKAVIFFPYLVNGIAMGFIFKFFYTHGFVLDTVLSWVGFNIDNLPYWLRDQRINNWALVYASFWRYVGQNMVLFIGAIMSIDPSLYEAAEIDGANKFQQFRYIILPGIQTIVTLNIILSITGSLSAFEGPYVITSGANGTGTYFVIMDRIAHTDQKVGLASAMAVFLLCLIFLATIAQRLIFKFAFRNAQSDDESYAAKKAKKKAAKQAKIELKQMKAEQAARLAEERSKENSK